MRPTEAEFPTTFDRIIASCYRIFGPTVLTLEHRIRKMADAIQPLQLFLSCPLEVVTRPPDDMYRGPKKSNPVSAFRSLEVSRCRDSPQLIGTLLQEA